MTENIKTVEATLSVSMFVNCPNADCDYYIDLMDERDTNGVHLDDDSRLIRQMFPEQGSNKDFECDGVVCTQCQTKFNVRELEW